MIHYEGMKAEESKGSNFGQLPAGPYVAVVLGVKVDGLSPDQSLVLQLDVSEGEYKDFFVKKYMSAKESGSKYGEPKFKGVYRLRIPNPSNKNAAYPESDLRRFNDMIYRFEKSNPGFRWDGDENKLKGLTVGINMQEDNYNGSTFTRIGRLETAQDVHAGLVRAMAPRKRQETPANTIDSQSGLEVVEKVELPFE